MKMLVLCEAYPNENSRYAMAFVHSRMITYVKANHEILVLSFRADVGYEYEGIKVITLKEFEEHLKVSQFDIILSHAPNLKHHIKFLFRHRKDYRKVIYFIHGHEVMINRKYFIKPYGYVKAQNWRRWLQKIYDPIKVRILKIWFTYQIKNRKAFFVFVSEWMHSVFIGDLDVNSEIIENCHEVIANPCNEHFMKARYCLDQEIRADFVTIRPFDNSKYAVDLVCEWAKRHPQYQFHVIGQGQYFDHHHAPNNLKVIQQFILQRDLPELLNHYRCALLPTRLDSQGVLGCEIASYGMPMITSEIPICREMLSSFVNVAFVPNDKSVELTKALEGLVVLKANEPNQRFSTEQTTLREIHYVQKCAKG